MPDERILTFDHHGVRIVYTRSGSGRRSFVLVHGIGMGHRVFRGLADELGEHGTVYAVDLPGFGDSPEPGSAQPMSATGDLVAAFIRERGIVNPVIVGHSMGTQVTVECVVRHPEVSDCIVLIAPTVNRQERTARQQAWRMAQDLVDESPRVLMLGLVQYAKAGPRWFIRKMRRMLEHEVESQLRKVRARTLVLRGEDDRVCPRDWVRFVAEQIPESTFREIPHRGHEAMIRSAQPTARMIVEFCRDR